MNPFREYHLAKIISLYEETLPPLDLLLRNYFRLHHAAGAKDRKWISETLYKVIRWQGLFDYLGAQGNWKVRVALSQTISPENYLNDPTIPPHIRVSFPKDFFDFLQHSLGREKSWAFCIASNEPAPTTIRANLLKTTRDTLLLSLQERFSVSPTPISSCGIIFHKRENFFALPEFKEGLFEVQDEGSQLVANLIEPRGKQQILDYCAGSGGKTLCFAPKTLGKGQIFLHDIRPSILLEAKKRLKRAGIQNAQILPPDSPYLEKLKNQMDWVLVDVPCSGTGTLRRNPDMKWKFCADTLHNLVAEQRDIFAKALPFLSPKGQIVYATCSVLPAENEEQIAYFEKEFSLQRVGEPLQTFPQSGKMDGFFATTLRRKPGEST